MQMGEMYRKSGKMDRGSRLGPYWANAAFRSFKLKSIIPNHRGLPKKIPSPTGQTVEARDLPQLTVTSSLA